MTPERELHDLFVEAMSSLASEVIFVPSGPRTSWSIAAATRSPLERVWCTRWARSPSQSWTTACSAFSTAAAARGSLVWVETGSLVTSSDCSTMRSGASTASTR